MNTKPIKVAVRRPSGPPNASRLRSAIKQCATFTCAPDDDLQPGGQLLTISDSFHDSLSKDFFEHVFVARPEFDDIYNSIGADRPILIEGLGGCGKTTTLLALRNRLGPEARRIAYVNAKSRSEELDANPALIWQFAYDELMRSVFAHLPPAARRAWPLTLVKQHHVYRALRDHILATEDPQTDEDWLELLNVKYLTIRLARDQELRPDQEAFRLLLTHLTSVGVIACVMLDGLDAVAVPTLRKIISSLFALSCEVLARWTPIIARRTTSWRQLSVPDPASLVADYHQLQQRSVQRLVQTKEGVVRDFLVKRLNYVSRKFADQEEPSDESERFRLLLLAFDQCLAETGLAHFLAEWYNGSLRACGVAIIDMLETLLTDADPVDSTGTIMHNVGEPSPFNQFIVRSFVYRHLTVTESAHGLQLIVPNVAFDSRRGSPPFELHAPVLHFLEYLSNKHGHGISLSVIREELAQFGFNDELIRSVLDCTVSHGSAPGMVLLDRMPQRDADQRIREIHPDTEFEILPRGRHFAMRLASSCEFLFWSALDAAAHGDFAHKKFKSTLSAEMVADPLFRADVALDVLSQRILPQVRRELAEQRERQAYFHHFSDARHQELYPERAARGIRAFLDSVPARGLADPPRRDRLRKLAEELRRDAEALHKE
jgi:hypothetical protein